MKNRCSAGSVRVLSRPGWLSLVLLFVASAWSQELRVLPNKPVYQPGETIGWTVRVTGGDAAQADYVLKKGGLSEMRRGKITLRDGQGQLEAKLDETGWLVCEITVNGADGKAVKGQGGALVTPELFKPAVARPEDFDSFWETKLKELSAVPANARLSAATAGQTNVDYYKITMNNIRGSRIQGQLARPRAGEKFPALLIVQWAGVYPLQKGWVTERAREGWLVLNLNAHDLPIDEPEQFYKDQSAGALKEYASIGNDDRETSYFLRMYLSCYRGAQYLAERPDWDGRTLVVTGGSQGGLQSLVTAALHPRITAVLACVPAGCDLNGPEGGRLPGWPMWHWNTKGKDEVKVRSAARYYDVVNFAQLVKCPVLVGVGLIDTVCPPPGVFAACNLVKGPKEIVILPEAEHGEKNGSHRPYYERFEAWKKVLVQGKPAPVQ